MPAETRNRHATQCDGSDALRRAAAEALRRSIRAGADAYERRRDLPQLTRLDPREIAGETVGNAETIVARLKRALRAERNRARSGHWTYDLNRHIALRQAYVAELERLRLMQAKAP